MSSWAVCDPHWSKHGAVLICDWPKALSVPEVLTLPKGLTAPWSKSKCPTKSIPTTSSVQSFHSQMNMARRLLQQAARISMTWIAVQCILDQIWWWTHNCTPALSNQGCQATNHLSGSKVVFCPVPSSAVIAASLLYNPRNISPPWGS